MGVKPEEREVASGKAVVRPSEDVESEGYKVDTGTGTTVRVEVTSVAEVPPRVMVIECVETMVGGQTNEGTDGGQSNEKDEAPVP